MEERYQELLKNESFIHAVADMLLEELLPQKSLTFKQKYNWEQRWKRIISGAEKEFAAQLAAYFEKQKKAVLAKLPQGKSIKGGPGSGEQEGHPFRGNQWTELGIRSDVVAAFSTLDTAKLRNATCAEVNADWLRSALMAIDPKKYQDIYVPDSGHIWLGIGDFIVDAWEPNGPPKLKVYRYDDPAIQNDPDYDWPGKGKGERPSYYEDKKKGDLPGHPFRGNQYRTGESDSAYMNAVAADDKKSMAEMVHAAARSAGYNVGPVYHASSKQLVPIEGAAYFSKEPRTTEFGKVVTSAYLRMQKPFYGAEGQVEDVLSNMSDDDIKQMMSEEDVTSIEELQDILRDETNTWQHPAFIRGILEEGFDSVESTDSFGGTTEYVVFKPHQIKSAELITRDEKGNVIPLSQRFNPKEIDIRKSIKKDYFSNTNWAFNVKEWQKMLQEYGDEFIQDLYDQIGSELFDYLKYVTGNQIEGAFDLEDPNVQDFIEEYSYQFAEGIMETTVTDLKAAMSRGMEEGLDIGEIADLIAASSTFSPERAMLIARTETIRASNYAAVEGYKQSGVVTKKEWLCTEDDRLCVWCASMNGMQFDLDEPFFKKDEDYTIGEGDEKETITLDYEDIDGPPLHPNCRCTLVPVVDEEYLTEEPPQEEKRGLAVILKGEGPGHPFRGNQWTDVAGEGPPLRLPTSTERNAAQRLIAHMAGGNDNEKAYVTTASGVPIEVQGSANRVIFREEDIAQANAIVHNHPAGASLSVNDCCVLLWHPHIRSIDAVTKGGTTYRLEKPETFPMPDTKEGRETLALKVAKEWHWKEEELRAGGYQKRFDDGEDGNVLWKEQTDKIMQYIAEEFGFRYSKWNCLDEEGKGFMLSLKSEGGTFVLDDSSISQHPYGTRIDVKGEGPGHPFRGNQYTDGESGTEGPKVSFVMDPQTDAEGYGWHEKGYAREWAESLSNDDLRVISNYVGFGYAGINGVLRGNDLPMREEKREPTDEERQRLIANEYRPIDLGDGSTLRLAAMQIRVTRDVVDTERVASYTKEAEALNDLIKNRGLVLREDMMVSRAGYIPGMPPEDFENLIGGAFQEKGFTSTFLGPAQGRATGTGYVTYGIAESKYRRYNMDILHPEVGTAVSFKIELPKGTKVIGAEGARRIRAYSSDLKRRTADLDDPNYRSESEIVLGSGAKYEIISVKRKNDLVTTGDKGTAKTPHIEVTARYIGGGSSERDV